MSVYTGQFQFLHRCYFVWEVVQLFSGHFVRCCKPNIFYVAPVRKDFDGLRSIEWEITIKFLPLSFDGLPLLSASNTELV
jgi:hypothetical protein